MIPVDNRKWNEFIAGGSGWWCPKCLKGVEVTGSDSMTHYEVWCNNCGMILHYCAKIQGGLK